MLFHTVYVNPVLPECDAVPPAWWPGVVVPKGPHWSSDQLLDLMYFLSYLFLRMLLITSCSTGFHGAVSAQKLSGLMRRKSFLTNLYCIFEIH